MQLYAKRLVRSQGGKHFSKTLFYFLSVRELKQSLQPIIFNWYLAYEKIAFAENLRVQPTILSMENIVFI